MIAGTKPIIVTGARGFLGRHLVTRLETAAFCVAAYGHDDLDVTDPEAVAAVLDSIRPGILIHCAAISSTKYAAEHPDESMAVNVGTCETMASLCAQWGIGLYVCSSDQVYGGCPISGPLSESLSLSPNNIYGQHKLLMESKVLDIHPGAIVMRLAWMFEKYDAINPHTDIISRFVDARRDALTLKASTREYRGMANVDEVCDNIIASFGILPGGVYNFGSGNLLDSYSTYLKLAAAAGLPSSSIIPDDSWGRNISMDGAKLASFGIRFADTVQAVNAVLSSD